MSENIEKWVENLVELTHTNPKKAIKMIKKEIAKIKNSDYKDKEKYIEYWNNAIDYIDNIPSDLQLKKDFETMRCLK